MMADLIIDSAFATYVLACAAHVYGGALFMLEGRKRKAVSSVFWWLMWLFWANAVYLVFEIHSRYLRFVDFDRYIDWMGTWWWGIRRVPTLILLIVFLIWMTRRFLTRRRNGDI